MSCEFSSAILGTHSTYSPNSEYLATITGGNKLTVRNSSSLDIVNIFSCVDKIENFEFSPDSCYIMCALYTRNSIQVFSLRDKDFKCRINEGVAGMVNSCWSPDSRSIVVESDFGIHLSFWSLVDATSTIVSLPKPSISQNIKDMSSIIAYSDHSQYLAVVHRIDLQDYIGVYSHVNSTISELVKFKPRTNDIAHIAWLPSDTHIVTVDSPLSYKFCVYTPSGENLMCYEAYQFALGIKSLALPCMSSNDNTTASSSCLLAVGSFDGKVRLISVFSWQLAFVLPLVHPKELNPAINAKNVITTVETLSASSVDDFSENSNQKRDAFQMKAGGTVKTLGKVGTAGKFAKSKVTTTVFRGSQSANSSVVTAEESSHQEVSFVQRMLKVLPRPSSETRNNKNSYPPMGVSWVGFSDNGQYLAARDDSFPRCLWIWDPVHSQLESLLVQLDPITCSQWRPAGTRADLPPILAFCTGNSRVYFWTPSGSSLADSADLQLGQEAGVSSVFSLKWNGNGTQLLLRSKESHCTCDVNFDALFSSCISGAAKPSDNDDDSDA